jgi:hypothetical protein
MQLTITKEQVAAAAKAGTAITIEVPLAQAQAAKQPKAKRPRATKAQVAKAERAAYGQELVRNIAKARTEIGRVYPTLDVLREQYAVAVPAQATRAVLASSGTLYAYDEQGNKCGEWTCTPAAQVELRERFAATCVKRAPKAQPTA